MVQDCADGKIWERRKNGRSQWGGFIRFGGSRVVGVVGIKVHEMEGTSVGSERYLGGGKIEALC